MLKVKSGYYHNCGINTDSTITCWGAGKTDADYFPTMGKALHLLVSLTSMVHTPPCAISIDNQEMVGDKSIQQLYQQTKARTIMSDGLRYVVF